ncbi:hypothetical protein ABID22_002520 [Pontibacter aydingkolensis]|uniref:Uncharacterized protein n=1 Tax=Pontibacter aydingkolensis TaxID=1911536 RepID=A0ABS7CWJ5_9BACT|nr:hypothetical protein [Pontibacter aydingkolensis]MBW7468148.1 hypothetical protein [Pontibacter aydingkolensis]
MNQKAPESIKFSGAFCVCFIYNLLNCHFDHRERSIRNSIKISPIVEMTA